MTCIPRQQEALFESVASGASFAVGVSVTGNFQVVIKTSGCRGKKLVSFWVNTAFVNRKTEVVTKFTIDSLRTDTKHKKVPAEFQVHLQFGTVSEQTVMDTAVAASFQRAGRHGSHASLRRTRRGGGSGSGATPTGRSAGGRSPSPSPRGSRE